ncbi:hypothetical protein FHR32_008496 [Streptosporangium album]|uniref:Uncharacterized protein n=1 Tax=Streptosporangium album TaxID=47479 RepID=A0A7W7S6E7_9ACTN|nr:hypothetical protein [Streptosporangium album]MBB4944093.1 hypothetical protein [Streptosporangium album]
MRVDALAVNHRRHRRFRHRHPALPMSPARSIAQLGAGLGLGDG